MISMNSMNFKSLYMYIKKKVERERGEREIFKLSTNTESKQSTVLNSGERAPSIAQQKAK